MFLGITLSSATVLSGIPNLNDHVPIAYAEYCPEGIVLPGVCDPLPSEGYNPDPALGAEDEQNQYADLAPPQDEGDEDETEYIECVIDSDGEEHCPLDMQQIRKKSTIRSYVCDKSSPYDNHCPPYSGYWKYKGSSVYFKVRKLY